MIRKRGTSLLLLLSLASAVPPQVFAGGEDAPRPKAPVAAPAPAPKDDAVAAGEDLLNDGKAPGTPAPGTPAPVAVDPKAPEGPAPTGNARYDTDLRETVAELEEQAARDREEIDKLKELREKDRAEFDRRLTALERGGLAGGVGAVGGAVANGGSAPSGSSQGSAPGPAGQGSSPTSGGQSGSSDPGKMSFWQKLMLKLLDVGGAALKKFVDKKLNDNQARADQATNRLDQRYPNQHDQTRDEINRAIDRGWNRTPGSRRDVLDSSAVDARTRRPGTIQPLPRVTDDFGTHPVINQPVEGRPVSDDPAEEERALIRLSASIELSTGKNPK